MPEPRTVPVCPPWCEGDHESGQAHYGKVGQTQHGAVRIEVNVRHRPHNYRGDPALVTVSAWDAPARPGRPGMPSVMVAAPWAEDLADLLPVLGHNDLAALVRQAAILAEEPRP